MKLSHILIGVILVFVSLQTLVQMKEKREAQDWPYTDGIISLASISDSKRTLSREVNGYRTRKEVTVYSLIVSYNYEVDGLAYQGSRLGFINNKTQSIKSVETLLEKFSPGKSVKVFYNPELPSESVLIK